MRLFCKREPSVLFYNASGFIISAYSLILTYNVIRIYHESCWRQLSYCGLHVRAVSVFGKNPMRFVVFWRISVRFCGSRIPLTPPSFTITVKLSPWNNELVQLICLLVTRQCHSRQNETQQNHDFTQFDPEPGLKSMNRITVLKCICNVVVANSLWHINQAYRVVLRLKEIWESIWLLTYISVLLSCIFWLRADMFSHLVWSGAPLHLNRINLNW